jgi:glycerate kinase
MKIVLAPNALKGCLTASQAAQAMARGVARACPNGEIVQVPVADGGDGLADVLMNALNGEARTVTVTGPRGDPVQATFCHVPARRLAAIEMATASGLALLTKDRLNPMLTTTLGTGELIAAALDLGISHLVIGIGGSATNDGGIGMAAALGARFLDGNGARSNRSAAHWPTIERIDLGGLDPRLAGLRVEAICDVDNPLLGERGAARVYAPQKGRHTRTGAGAGGRTGSSGGGDRARSRPGRARAAGRRRGRRPGRGLEGFPQRRAAARRRSGTGSDRPGPNNCAARTWC